MTVRFWSGPPQVSVLMPPQFEPTPAGQTPPPAQVVPSGTETWVTPVAGSQPSLVHVLPSFTSGGVPARQLPAPSHVSSPLHALSSAQDAPGSRFAPGLHVP